MIIFHIYKVIPNTIRQYIDLWLYVQICEQKKLLLEDGYKKGDSHIFSHREGISAIRPHHVAHSPCLAVTIPVDKQRR